MIQNLKLMKIMKLSLPRIFNPEHLNDLIFMCRSCHLDSTSNVEIGVKIKLFIYFFVLFCVKKNRTKRCGIFILKPCNLFYILKVPPKKSQEQFNTQYRTTEIFQIQRKFQHLTIGPNDMVHTLVDAIQDFEFQVMLVSVQLFHLIKNAMTHKSFFTSLIFDKSKQKDNFSSEIIFPGQK